MMYRRGALLLEAVIAASLVSVAMIAVAQLLAVAVRQDRVLEQRRLAVEEAANALERSLAVPWNDLDDDQTQEIARQANAAFSGGELQMQVERLEDKPAAKRITAEVSWETAAGTREAVRLTAWSFQTEEAP